MITTNPLKNRRSTSIRKKFIKNLNLGEVSFLKPKSFEVPIIRCKTAKKSTNQTELPCKGLLASRKFSEEPLWKKSLRGRLNNITNKNIILQEKVFNPLSLIESLTNKKMKKFKLKFKNMESRNKIGIFTNKYPHILKSNKYYERFFDNFISPDELLDRNFNEKEIYEILTDPGYYKYESRFGKTGVFVKKTLTETLNEEEKVGPDKLLRERLNNSLKKTKKKVDFYLGYYTNTLRQKDLINI